MAWPYTFRPSFRTLGVIISVHYGIGKRNLNLDNLEQGNMWMDMWDHMPWDGIAPLVLRMKTAAGKKANGTIHADELMHNRCPLRCPLRWLGAPEPLRMHRSVRTCDMSHETNASLQVLIMRTSTWILKSSFRQYPVGSPIVATSEGCCDN